MRGMLILQKNRDTNNIRSFNLDQGVIIMNKTYIQEMIKSTPPWSI